MVENYWVVEALIGLVNSEDFQKTTTNFLNEKAKEFHKSSFENKLKIWQGYQIFYNVQLVSFFKDLGLTKEQYSPAIHLLLTSKEGFEDTRLSSEFIATDNYDIFSNLTEYFYAGTELKEVVTAGASANVIAEQEKLYELAEVNLALKLSTEIEERMKKPIVKTSPIPKKTISSNTSTKTTSSSPSSSLPSNLFQLTGVPLSTPPPSSVTAQQTHLTPLSPSIITTNLNKLKQMEDNINKQLISIRETQEKQVRGKQNELAKQIEQKRVASYTAQKKK